MKSNGSKQEKMAPNLILTETERSNEPEKKNDVKEEEQHWQG